MYMPLPFPPIDKQDIHSILGQVSGWSYHPTSLNNMQDFRTIERRSLYQDIVRQIQELIKDGTLQPGDRLPSERELADRLQVSRGSLREAIRALELQGLVVSRPGAGTFVNNESLDTLVSMIASSLTQENGSLTSVFEVRHLLEPQIASLAAERAGPEDIQQMVDALRDQDGQIGRGETGVEGDTAFHFAIAQAAHNWALLKVISTVADILRQSRDQSLQTPGRPQRSLSSHRYILEMIRARDGEGARSAMEHHLLDVEPTRAPPDGRLEAASPAATGPPT